MEVTWADPVRRRDALKQELHYISKLGASMQRCSERILVIISVHMRTLLQAYETEYNQGQKAGIRLALREFADSVTAALDYTKLDTIATVGNSEVLQIGKSLRDDAKRVPK